MLHLCEGPELRTHFWKDREEKKKAQHPVGFKPMTPCSTSMCSTAVQQPLHYLSEQPYSCNLEYYHWCVFLQEAFVRNPDPGTDPNANDPIPKLLFSAKKAIRGSARSIFDITEKPF